MADDFGGGIGGLDVGGVKATLGYEHDRTGLRQWDRALDEAERRAAVPVEAELKGDYDRRGFDQYSRATKKAERDSKLLSRATGAAGTGLMAVGKAGLYAGGALGVGFALGAYKSVQAASDLNESINASNAIFEDSGPRIQKWSRTAADSLGLARSEALQAAASIGAMLKPMGFTEDRAARMSQKMVQLAGDMASFNNEDPSEMLERIRSGLAGESEPLRRFGVDLRVTAVQAFAVREGLIKQGEALQGAALVQASYQKILADTADQQGDFERTSTGLANTQRRLRANTIDLAAVMGKELQPEAKKAAAVLNDFVLEMKNGSGAGGEFRRDLQRMVGDVEGFAKEIAGILGDDALSNEEKLTKVFDRFSEVAVDAINEAGPMVAGAAGRMAPDVALAFVRGFLRADAWGKIAIGGWLISKLGGAGAFATIGKRVGGFLGLSMASSAAATVAGGAAAASGGASAGGAAVAGAGAGGLISKLKGIKWARVGGLGIGLALGSGILSELDRSLSSEGSDLFAELERKSGVYGHPGPQNALSRALGSGGDEEAQDLLDRLKEIEETAGGVSKEYADGVDHLIEINDLSREQEALAREILKTAREQGHQERALADMGVEIKVKTPLPKDVLGNLHQLRAGVFTTLQDIQKVSRRNARGIARSLGAGTEEGRKVTALNMRATAAAIKKGMDAGVINVREGRKRIRALLRSSDLVEGIHPRDFADKWAKALGDGGKITQNEVDSIIRQMAKMPPKARQIAFDALNDQLGEYRKGGKRQEREVDKTNSRILTRFSTLRKGAARETRGLGLDVARNFFGLSGAIAGALSTIHDNVGGGLQAFGVDAIKWSIKKAGAAQSPGSYFQGRARGGFLPGSSREDVVPVLAGKDEAFVTSWQQRPIETALAASSAMGVQPYGSLDELFSGETRRHSAGPQRIPRRRERGGFGGFDVDGATPGFVPFMSYLNSLFGPIFVLSGNRPGSITTTGNVSNHASGHAVDISTHENGLEFATGEASLNATGIAAKRMDALHGFMAAHIGLPGDFLWRTYVGGNHYNHIHRGITSREADDPAAMMAYLSRLPNAGFLGGIPNLKLDGPDGPLRDFGQGAIDAVREAANKWIGSQGFFGAGGAGGAYGTHGGGGPDANRQLARDMMLTPGKGWGPWGPGEWPPLDRLWTSESNFDEHATNPDSGAYGIPQSLPAEKMAASGPDWRDNPGTQIDWGLKYIDAVYGAPSATPLGGYERGGWIRAARGLAGRGGARARRFGAAAHRSTGSVAQTMAAVLLRNKLDPEATSGVMGNSYGESGWIPDNMEPGTDNGGLFGFTAHPVARSDLVAYAESQGKPWDDVTTQVQFMLHHLSDSLKNKLNGLSSTDDTTLAFMDDWERPLNHSSLGKRQAKAAHVLPWVSKMAKGGAPVGEDAPDWIEGLKFGPLPDSIRGCQIELRERTAQLEALRKQLPKIKKDDREKAQKAIVRLRDRIAQLSKKRKKLIAAKRARIRARISKLGILPYFEGQLAKFDGEDGKIAVDSDKAQRLVDLEPETFASAEDFDAYMGKESDAYKKVLGDQWRLRQTLARGLLAGKDKGQELDKREKQLRDRLHEKTHFVKGPHGVWDGHTVYGPDKQERSWLKWMLGQYETTEKHLEKELLPSFVSRMIGLQGPGESYRPLASMGPIGELGGEIFQTRLTLDEILGRDFEASDAGDASSALETTNAALLEELERYRRRDRIVQAQAPVFGGDLASWLATGGLNYGQAFARGGRALEEALLPIQGSYRVGTQFVPADGVYQLHRGEEIRSKERVAEAGGGETFLLLDASAEALDVRVREISREEFESRGGKAAAAQMRPAAGVIARKVQR